MYLCSCTSSVPLLFLSCAPVLPLVPLFLPLTWGHWGGLKMPYGGTLLSLYSSFYPYKIMIRLLDQAGLRGTQEGQECASVGHLEIFSTSSDWCRGSVHVLKKSKRSTRGEQERMRETPEGQTMYSRSTWDEWRTFNRSPTLNNSY